MIYYEILINGYTWFITKLTYSSKIKLAQEVGGDESEGIYTKNELSQIRQQIQDYETLGFNSRLKPFNRDGIHKYYPSHRCTKDIVESVQKENVNMQDFKALTDMVNAAKSTASKQTHYHQLNEWSNPIWDHIHNMLKKTGFKNGEPEENAKNLKTQFWWSVYQLFSNIVYSPNLKTEVATHHSSAWERNEAFSIELSIISKKLSNG